MYAVHIHGSDIAPDVGALKIRIGFWGPFYYNCNKEPPK